MPELSLDNMVAERQRVTITRLDLRIETSDALRQEEMPARWQALKDDKATFATPSLVGLPVEAALGSTYVSVRLSRSGGKDLWRIMWERVTPAMLLGTFKARSDEVGGMLGLEAFMSERLGRDCLQQAESLRFDSQC